jgi:hypothetical protein
VPEGWEGISIGAAWLAEGFQEIARGNFETLPARAAFIRIAEFINAVDVLSKRFK